MSKYIIRGKEYKVKDNDTPESIAKANGLKWPELAKYNFGTDDPTEINKYLGGSRVGCTKKSTDGKNYIFTSKDDPGIIHIPSGNPQKKFSSNSEHIITVKIPQIKIPPPAKCKVKFWPQPGWKGEFGFDWLRDGQSGLQSDVDYETIIGAYPENADPDYSSSPQFHKNWDNTYNNLENEYAPFYVRWKKDQYYKNDVAFLCLFPQNECTSNPKKPWKAELNFHLEIIESNPINLKFMFGNRDGGIDEATETSEYLEVVGDLPKSTGAYTKPMTIKCIKGFNRDLEISVVNCTNDSTGKEYREKIGKLILLRNSKEFCNAVNVVFVKVKTNLKNFFFRSSVKVGETKGEQPYLEKYLFQSHTNLNLKEEEFDLSNDKFFSLVNSKIHFDKKLLKFYIDIDSNIHSYLEDKFNKEKSTPEINYEEWYKVFFIKEFSAINRSGGGGYFTLGQAKDIGSKCVVVFDGKSDSTATHELFHAFGLYHSFSNSSPHIFEKFKTDNIMDYESNDYPDTKTKFTTWMWQWMHINPLL